MFYNFLILLFLLFLSASAHAVDPDEFIGLEFKEQTQKKISSAPIVSKSPKSGKLHKPGAVWTEPTTGMEFVWIPGGCFMMGQTDTEKAWLIRISNENRYKTVYSDEVPRHKVCVSGFWMGRFEVTNAQYRKFKSSHNSGKYKKRDLNGNSQPAVEISWHAARKYADWLSGKGNGVFRLPTEAEWEYAARAGTSAKRYGDGSKRQACTYANIKDRTYKASFKEWNTFPCDDGYVLSAPVGRFKSNAFGIYDMLGNVGEWCEDTYNPKAYSVLSGDNPIYSTEGKHRVIRGGSWGSSFSSARFSDRSYDMPQYGYRSVGFRLIRIR